MEPEVAFSLFVATIGAVAMPPLARKISLPASVLEMAFGVLVGASGLKLVESTHDLKLLSGLGFALFLLLAGMEIDVATLVRNGVRPLLLPIVAAIAALAVALGLAARIGIPQWIGLAAGVLSVPLVLAVLKEANLDGTLVGRTVILAAAIGELTSISLLAVFDIGAGAKGGGPLAWLAGLGWATVPLLTTLLLGMLLRTLLWWYPDPFLRFVATEDRQEFGVRAGLLLMFGGIVITAIGGIEPLLGAFFAGLLVSYVLRDPSVIEHKLSGAAYGFFVPLFFVHVGIRLDVGWHEVLDNAAFMTAVLLVTLGSRIPSFLAFNAAGMSLRDATAGALLLASPLTLQIAVAELAVQNHIVPVQIEAALVIAAVLGGVLFPAIARQFLSAAPVQPHS